ncbi:MAG TPA: bifunctional hydroxymethylpyrimidine kinase/phosphomethylpyrimidine kinase, partial [Chitinophagaceae bacterium]|nr:bifunctional hydroxymethylpyrimidine kinase/phosphomethylpyrimidine kinase [Chitinophagaceae bacterium]
MVPLATILTPNTHEAAKLLGTSIRNEEEMQEAALSLLALGPQAVIVK